MSEHQTLSEARESRINEAVQFVDDEFQRVQKELSARRKSLERDVRIGGPADLEAFDIRFFSHSHGPNPSGLAPGEAYERARELADVGITSVVFKNHWGVPAQSERDIRSLREIVGAVGLDAETFFAKIADPAYKARLKANTDEVIARGGFGSPTLFVNGDDMYFGNDRLDLVRDALRR